MTIREFADQFVESRAFDHLADEMHWEGGWDAKLFEGVLQRAAKNAGIELTEIDDFEPDNYYESYQCCEKGLS